MSRYILHRDHDRRRERQRMLEGGSRNLSIFTAIWVIGWIAYHAFRACQNWCAL